MNVKSRIPADMLSKRELGCVLAWTSSLEFLIDFLLKRQSLHLFIPVCRSKWQQVISSVLLSLTVAHGQKEPTLTKIPEGV